MVPWSISRQLCSRLMHSKFYYIKPSAHAACTAKVQLTAIWLPVSGSVSSATHALLVEQAKSTSRAGEAATPASLRQQTRVLTCGRASQQVPPSTCP